MRLSERAWLRFTPTGRAMRWMLAEGLVAKGADGRYALVAKGYEWGEVGASEFAARRRRGEQNPSLN